MALMLLNFSPFSWASSKNDTSLDLRILFTTRDTQTASRFRLSSSTHMAGPSGTQF